jgi:hypothetical protein
VPTATDHDVTHAGDAEDEFEQLPAGEVGVGVQLRPSEIAALEATFDWVRHGTPLPEGLIPAARHFLQRYRRGEEVRDLELRALLLGALEEADPHAATIERKRDELAQKRRGGGDLDQEIRRLLRKLRAESDLAEETLRALLYFDLKAAHKERGLAHPEVAAPSLVRAIRNESRPRARTRSPGRKPIRRRGSRRGSAGGSRRCSAPTRGDPGSDGESELDGESDSEPPRVGGREPLPSLGTRR